MKQRRALNSQTVRAKEHPLATHGGPSQRQTSGTDRPMKVLIHGRLSV